MKNPPSVIVLNRFSRFTQITQTYDQMKATYHILWRHSLAPRLFSTTADRARELFGTFGDGGRAALQALWPGANIDNPSRAFFLERLAALVGSFPGGAPHAGELFAATMLQHVVGEEPSMMVLESACRHLVETKRLVPAISDLLPVLREQKKKWAKRLEIDEMIRDGRLAAMQEKLIAELERPLADWERHSREVPRFADFTPESREMEKIRRQFKQELSESGLQVSEFAGLGEEEPTLLPVVHIPVPRLSAPANDEDDDERGLEEERR
jgi:hypothetical protein